MSQQRILIVLENDEFKGASQHDGGQKPMPLTLDALTALIPTLNTAAVAKATAADEAIAAAVTERDTALTEVEAAITALAEGNPGKATAAIARARARKTATARKVAELQAQKADIVAQLAKLK